MNEHIGYPIDAGKTYTISAVGIKGVIFFNDKGKEISREYFKTQEFKVKAPKESISIQLIAGQVND